MNKRSKDEHVEQLARTLVRSGGADRSVVDAAAGSATLWTAVQRNINAQQETERSPWPPVGKLRRWLMILTPATFAAVLLIAMLWAYRPIGVKTVADVAGLPAQQVDVAVHSPDSIVTSENAVPPEGTAIRAEKASVRKTSAKKERARVASVRPSMTTSEPITSEFIALSYARDPASGQIVRIKVPSSMMVSLGLMPRVNDPSRLVNAEVVVGDDGLTRAIRFIR